MMQRIRYGRCSRRLHCANFSRMDLAWFCKLKASQHRCHHVQRPFRRAPFTATCSGLVA